MQIRISKAECFQDSICHEAIRIFFWINNIQPSIALEAQISVHLTLKQPLEAKLDHRKYQGLAHLCLLILTDIAQSVKKYHKIKEKIEFTMILLLISDNLMVSQYASFFDIFSQGVYVYNC